MSSIKNHATYYNAPPGLEEKIRRGIRNEGARTAPWRVLAIAASALLMTSLAWNILLLRQHVDPESLTAANILSAHVRSLAGTHLLDVPSSDQHTVKPWFNGKLDFSPSVKFLDDDFPLLGGRLEYLEGRPAAALIYGRNKHIINLFTWPAASPSAEAAESRNGYNMLHWSAGGMTYWAVSDLNDSELRRFVSLYRAK